MGNKGRAVPRLVVYPILGVAVLVVAAALWAERTGQQSGIAFRLDVVVHRLGAFPGAVKHRDARCSYADAWSLSPPVDQVLAQTAVQKTFRVEERDGSLERVRTPAGAYWIPSRDVDTLAETIVEQQSDIYEAGGGSIGSGDVVLDCGANVGLYTRHALDKGAKVVIAIEPAPEALECLRRNFAAEVSSGRVVIYPKGVWNKDEELPLSISNAWASTAASVVLDRGGAGPKILLTTIDKLVAELHLSSVSLIKMDIEGSEMQALEGAIETVRRFRPRMAISLEHRPSDPDRIPELVRRLWPSYATQCGPCANVNGRIQPDVMFAHAQ